MVSNLNLHPPYAAVIEKLEERRNELQEKVSKQDAELRSQKEQMGAAQAELRRLRAAVNDANKRAEDAEEHAAQCIRARNQAAEAMKAAQSHAMEEGVKRGIAWDMGKQHALGGATVQARHRLDPAC